MTVDMLICIFIGLFCLSGFSYYCIKIYNIFNCQNDYVIEVEDLLNE